MSFDTPSWTEPITEPDILAGIEALPTEDDLPCDDGEPMETARHHEQMDLLIQSLRAYWAERTDYYVAGNMFLHYDPENRRKSRGPDFFLVLDVNNRERKSWVVWQERMRFPDVIIELLSDTTRDVDKGEKKVLYEREFRTAEYYLYDPFSQEFIGYHLHGVQYEEAKPDGQGRIFSPATGLYLGPHEGWLRWMTREGDIVPSPMELATRQRQRAEHAEQQAENAEQRANQAEQLLAKYRERFGEVE
jgi:Uma2 family endonuclease